MRETRYRADQPIIPTMAETSATSTHKRARDDGVVFLEQVLLSSSPSSSNTFNNSNSDQTSTTASPATSRHVLPALLLSGIMLSSVLMWDHFRDRAHYTADLMLRGQVPRNFTQITDAAANSLASVFSGTGSADDSSATPDKKKKKLSPLEVLGYYSYLPPKQNIWNMQPQDPKNITRPKLVNEEDFPGVYIPLHQNILNEETMEALRTPLTKEEYKEAMAELDKRQQERIENEKRGVTKPPAVIRRHNDGPDGDGSVTERLVYYNDKPTPRRKVDDSHNDGLCGTYETTGWHEPDIYTAVLKPTDSPDKKQWKWQECAAECARRKPEECEYWTLQLTQDRNCLLLVGRGKYTDSGGHAEGDRDLDCLDEKTWEATAA